MSWQVVVGLHLSVNYRLNPAFLSQIDLVAVHDKESASNGSQWDLWDKKELVPLSSASVPSHRAAGAMASSSSSSSPSLTSPPLCRGSSAFALPWRSGKPDIGALSSWKLGLSDESMYARKRPTSFSSGD